MNQRAITFNRRRALAAMAGAGICAAHAQQPSMDQIRPGKTNLARTSLHQDIELDAAARRIFDALLDSKQFAAFTAMPAEIDGKPGGAFKTFGGLIEGRTIEIVDVQRIVQAWRPASWDAGVYSIVRFELKMRGQETTLVLDHTGFPEGDYDHLDAGWYTRYWNPMKKWLAESL